MGNRFYIEPGRSPLMDTAGIALKLMDLKQSADISKTHAGLMKEDQALRGREFERKGEEMGILYGQPGATGQRTGGLKQQELGLTERGVAAKEAEIPFHKAKFNPADMASTELKLGYAKKMSGVDIGKILSPILEPMKEAVKNPQATPERGSLVKHFTGQSWPFYQQAIMDNLVAEGEKLNPGSPKDQPAIQKIIRLMDAVGQDPDGTGTLGFASGEMGRTIEAMNLEQQEIAAKGKQPASEIQEYNAYAGQETKAGRQPLSFFDYQKQLKEAGKTQVNVTNKVGQESMAKLGEEMSKSLVEERTKAMDALFAYNNQKEARNLIKSGMITGTGADYIIGLGNLLSSRLGFNAATDPVANSQAFVATMGNQVGQIIKQFGSGTGLSDADREYAEKIVGGKITLNEKSILKLMDINEKAYKNAIYNYNKKADQAMKKPGADSLPFDLRVEFNETSKTGKTIVERRETADGKTLVKYSDGTIGEE